MTERLVRKLILNKMFASNMDRVKKLETKGR